MLKKRLFLSFLIIASTSVIIAESNKVSSLLSTAWQDHSEFFSKKSFNCFCQSPWNFIKNLGFSDVVCSADSGNGMPAAALNNRTIRPPYLLIIPAVIVGGYVMYKKYTETIKTLYHPAIDPITGNIIR